MLGHPIRLWTSFVCNVYLSRISRSWTDRVQTKSSMTFIRGEMCLEREKDNFKNGGDVDSLKESALALKKQRRVSLNKTSIQNDKCIWI